MTILFCLFTNISISQVVAIQNQTNMTLRLCIYNHLTIAVEGHRADEIIVSTNNGSIRQDEALGSGHFIYQANMAGTSMIFVGKQIGNRIETIDSVRFRIYRIPILPPKFAGKSKGLLDHSVIMAQLGIIVHGDIHGDRTFPVNSYSVVVNRKGKEIFKRSVAGPRIDKVTSDFFQSLKNNDQLKFQNIEVLDCDGQLRKAEEIDIIVTNAVKDGKGKTTDTLYVEDPVSGELILKLQKVGNRKRK